MREDSSCTRLAHEVSWQFLDKIESIATTGLTTPVGLVEQRCASGSAATNLVSRQTQMTEGAYEGGWGER